MNRIKRSSLAILHCGSLGLTAGCALFTAQRVGTFAAKEAGKQVVRGYREHREHERSYHDSSTDGDRSDYRQVKDRSEE